MNVRWAALAALATLACSGTGVGAAELQGTRWSLVELAGEAVTPVGDGTSGYLRFERADHRFGASVGCNSMGGNWHSNGSSLGFSEVASTEMACEEPLMSRERQLAQAVTSTTGYRLSNERLELLAGQRVLAAFTTEVAP